MTADDKVLSFLWILEEYWVKCENEGSYTEAKKARLKYENCFEKKLLAKRTTFEQLRNKNFKVFRMLRRSSLMSSVKLGITTWMNMKQQHNLSLEKLKEKHLLEFEKFKESVRWSQKEIQVLKRLDRTLIKRSNASQAQAIRRSWKNQDEIRSSWVIWKKQNQLRHGSNHREERI